MQKFLEKFRKLEGCKGKVILFHQIFDRQIHKCDHIRIVEDDNRVGVRIKDQDIFVYKQDVKATNITKNNSCYRICDEILSILVFAENL